MEATMVEPTPKPVLPISAQKLGFGVLLVIVGGLIFVDAIDVWDFRNLWRHYWPMVLLFIGLMMEIDSLRTRTNAGGGYLLALGVWFQVAALRLFGLNYRSAFPLAIVVFGLLMIIHAIVDLPEEKAKEETNHANK
jgi:hypothetical protein